MTSTFDPPSHWLHKFVAEGHLRYWIISTWALALATVVPLIWVAGWYAVTMASGFARAISEQREHPLPRAPRIAVATACCIAWAGAPLIAWFIGGADGDVLTAVLLCGGYFLVFTQMRAAPREALIVSSPYSVATVVILWSAFGDPEFWTVIAALPVMATALLIKVLITQLKDRELRAVVQHQAELIVELEKARDDANAASQAKSNFLAVISHELRTPMNGVLGAAHLLHHANLSDRENQYVDIIRDSGGNLLELLNDLLDVSKMEAGRLELHPQTIVLEDVYGRLIGPCRTQAEAKGLDLDLVCLPNLPPRILADPVRLGQVVQNLLSNAIKFTSDGRVTLTVASFQDDDRTFLSFAVRDTGPGISADGLSRLFQPFVQLDDTATRRFGGTGLGLTIARRIAREMGGDIVVTSTPGNGSEFVFTAVVERLEDDAWPEAVRPVGEDPSSSLDVLVVEDHPVNRMVLNAWLLTQGHRCQLAEHGEEGLAAASRMAFDVILMDVNMPVMDGLTATRKLRQQPGPNQRTPVVILSASARQQDHEVGLAAGASAYLNKPIIYDELAALFSGLEELRSHMLQRVA